MGNPTNAATIGPLVLRVQADGLFNANDVAQRIVNMSYTEEQTLHTVVGPTAYVPKKVAGNRPNSRSTPVDTAVVGAPTIDPTNLVYGFRQHGLFHTVMPSGKELLLLHTGNELWEWQGWDRNWRKLISPVASSYGVTGDLPDKPQADFPTQFTYTGNGVVITPQQGPAHFYDGAYIAPLGFSQTPSSPTARGPSSSGKRFRSKKGRVNNRGYAHTSSHGDATVDSVDASGGTGVLAHNAMTEGFGNCRIGTIEVISIADPDKLEDAASGWVFAGEWRCAVQYIDRWGNLSAASTPSSAATTDTLPAVVAVTNYEEPHPRVGAVDEKRLLPNVARVQLKWEGISTGPDHCVGRILYRTKDTRNTGDSTLYYLSQNALSVPEYATIPDNVVTDFPDNIPDTWLGDPLSQYLTVPEFRLATMALGRLWIGNFIGGASTVRPSEPNLWGTFKTGFDLTPDPTSEITGMAGVTEGLLVCTTSSSFLVISSDDGQGFKYNPLSKTVGCAAPSSMVALPEGPTIFLGREGFYMYKDGGLQYVSPELRRTMKRLTYARLKQAVAAYDPRSREYRCWVSLDGSERNNRCFVYGPSPDGSRGWRERDDMVVDSVCTTTDHRRYMLVGGNLTDDNGHSGVYLLDHAHHDISELTKNREGLIETGWLEASDSDKAKTSYVVYLWLRETENTKVTVDVLRNWREKVIDTHTTDRYSRKDVPDFWASTKLGTGTWRDKRPYWTRVPIHVPSAESVKFRIRGTGNWEFVGLQVKMSPRYYGGAQLSP